MRTRRSCAARSRDRVGGVGTVVDIEWTDDEDASLEVIMQQLVDHAWPPVPQP